MGCNHCKVVLEFCGALVNEVNDGGLEILVFSETLASWVFSFQILVIYLILVT